jgi:GGDEF domain-containing protein
VLTVSVGGATLPEAGPGEAADESGGNPARNPAGQYGREGADELFGAADAHLYRAKQAGRNRVVWRLPG